MKKIIKPFDLETSKNGAKTEMKCGFEVEILKWNVKNSCPIVGVVKVSDTCEFIGTWATDGSWVSDFDCPVYSLVIVEYENEEDK
jgi:hypothetical protein